MRNEAERTERRKRWGDRVPVCVVFIGLPAAGKSTYFRARFVDTHIRINGDMLRTAARERLLVEACLQGGTSFVVDKTNVSRAERARYIDAAHEAGFLVHGYFFESRKDLCLDRNAKRPPHERVPDAAVLGMRSRMELPSREEGFDELSFVRGVEGTWIVEAYR
ncbi:ATP-binding protein [Polyangium mundeleinium]|uniref:ATP-binding protein n=1 Tax=Polyangium mundeleinium TaxID=2995306 RepID=A0ABT5ES42_9BACT|nr:ATP-binding protein [Polyangium mundeleinium]MDC0744628.1 ATP-binding protein [Polyangium mundeleinium]